MSTKLIYKGAALWKAVSPAQSDYNGNAKAIIYNAQLEHLWHKAAASLALHRPVRQAGEPGSHPRSTSQTSQLLAQRTRLQHSCLPSDTLFRRHVPLMCVPEATKRTAGPTVSAWDRVAAANLQAAMQVPSPACVDAGGIMLHPELACAASMPDPNPWQKQLQQSQHSALFMPDRKSVV